MNHGLTKGDCTALDQVHPPRCHSTLSASSRSFRCGLSRRLALCPVPASNATLNATRHPPPSPLAQTDASAASPSTTIIRATPRAGRTAHSPLTGVMTDIVHDAIQRWILRTAPT